jgi:hypothetical protein
MCAQSIIPFGRDARITKIEGCWAFIKSTRLTKSRFNVMWRPRRCWQHRGLLLTTLYYTCFTVYAMVIRPQDRERMERMRSLEHGPSPIPSAPSNVGWCHQSRGRHTLTRTAFHLSTAIGTSKSRGVASLVKSSECSESPSRLGWTACFRSVTVPFFFLASLSSMSPSTSCCRTVHACMYTVVIPVIILC